MKCAKRVANNYQQLYPILQSNDGEYRVIRRKLDFKSFNRVGTIEKINFLEKYNFEMSISYNCLIRFYLNFWRYLSNIQYPSDFFPK